LPTTSRKESAEMAKLFRCYDIYPDCPAEVRAETEQEILRHVAEHATSVHGVKEVDEGTVQKVRAAIRTES
jgi:predicted small metal-binding protein